MFAVVTPEKIALSPGAVVRLPGNWQDYQALVEQLGDRAVPSLKYRPGEILLMSPLPIHGRQVHLLSNIIMMLWDYLGREYEGFTPITMQLPEESGIEPDYCFYLEHWQEVTGKDRLDWQVDPAPDLVIEVDVTSYTDVNDYLPYGVPEVWLLRQNQLVIYSLQGEGYKLESTSRFCPGFDVVAMVGEALQLTSDRNSSFAIRELRRRLTL